MEIKFKKLNENAVEPKQGTPFSAGFDLVAVSKEQLDMYHTRFGTGLAFEIPEGYVGLVFARSSCYKNGSLLTNGVGVIDSDYRGEVMAVFLGTSKDICYDIGDRICQLVIIPIPQVKFIFTEKLSETERGTGGYGSTGNK